MTDAARDGRRDADRGEGIDRLSIEQRDWMCRPATHGITPSHGGVAGDYISLRLDDPSFGQPIRANLFQADDKGTEFDLLWSRPPRRNETA